jgi:hypothetical protein
MIIGSKKKQFEIYNEYRSIPVIQITCLRFALDAFSYPPCLDIFGTRKALPVTFGTRKALPVTFNLTFGENLGITPVRLLLETSRS